MNWVEGINEGLVGDLVGKGVDGKVGGEHEDGVIGGIEGGVIGELGYGWKADLCRTSFHDWRNEKRILG